MKMVEEESRIEKRDYRECVGEGKNSKHHSLGGKHATIQKRQEKAESRIDTREAKKKDSFRDQTGFSSMILSRK